MEEFLSCDKGVIIVISHCWSKYEMSEYIGSCLSCSVLCEDEKQAIAVKSQLQQLARPMYSNPPVHGALIVSTILGDPDLKKLWLKEVKVINSTKLIL